MSWLKDPDAGKDWRQEKGTTKDETVGWHHQLYRHKCEQAPGDGEGQGSLACCSLRDRRVAHDEAAEQQTAAQTFTTNTTSPAFLLMSFLCCRIPPCSRPVLSNSPIFPCDLDFLECRTLPCRWSLSLSSPMLSRLGENDTACGAPSLLVVLALLALEWWLWDYLWEETSGLWA